MGHMSKIPNSGSFFCDVSKQKFMPKGGEGQRTKSIDDHMIRDRQGLLSSSFPTKRIRGREEDPN